LYPRILKRIRNLIRDGRYVVTVHALDEMDDDGLTVFDVEGVILTGEITERQRDSKSREWKYLVRGKTIEDLPASVALKIGPTEKLVVITVYVEER
jgi:hypothetical protein